MSAHYSDYLKKSVSIKDLKFDPVQEEDKDLIRRVFKEHVKNNLVFIILLSLGFFASVWYFASFLIIPANNIVFQIVALGLLGFSIVVCAYYLHGFFGAVSGIRRGIVLSSSSVHEESDGRFATHAYVFDIYLDDKDETLMSYNVDRETCRRADAGDGVILFKIGRKIKVLADPDRKKVMDVSNIKSGV